MADIIKLNSQGASATPAEDVEDPKIVKIAKLVLILADKGTEDTDKLCCIKLAVRLGYITQEESKQLLAHKSELEEFMVDPDEV